MHHIDEVTLDFDTRGKILSKILIHLGAPEMSLFDSAFLCGLIKMKKPKKLLEVGVSGGGTTAVILQCMEDIGQPYEMHSVDVCKSLYRNPQYKTGILGEYAKDILHVKNHKFHLGGTVVDFIDSVGGNIDFLVLDTTHRLLGELLDFLILIGSVTNSMGFEFSPYCQYILQTYIYIEKRRNVWLLRSCDNPVLIYCDYHLPQSHRICD